MWTREDTRYWITQLENRIEDIDYYLQRTVQWCEDNYVYDNDQVFIYSFITCVWVSYQRNEAISYSELLEILGIEKPDEFEDKIYELGDQFTDIDHEELLETLHKKIRNF